MKKVTIFLMLVLLVSMFGCTSNNAQINKKGTTQTKNEGATAQHAKRVSPSKNGVPLLLTIPKYNAARTEVVEERSLLGHWDLQTGSISFEGTSLPVEQFNSDPKWTRNNGEGMTLSSPLPGAPSYVLRLYFSGTSNNYVELATYDVPSKDRATSGKLLLGEYNKSRERWRKVKGSCLSLVAAYTPDVIKAGSKLYIDDKRGYTVEAIDLNKDPLELVNYAPANELIGQVKDVLDAPETPPLGFGSYQDILLIEVGGNTKSWIWAMQNDKCIGKIYADSKEKKLVSYKGDKAVSKKHLSETWDGIKLPRK